MPEQWMRLTVRCKAVEYHVGLCKTVEHLGQPMVRLVTAEVPGEPRRWRRGTGQRRRQIVVSHPVACIPSETRYFSPRAIIAAEPTDEANAQRVALSDYYNRTRDYTRGSGGRLLTGKEADQYAAEHPDEEAPDA